MSCDAGILPSWRVKCWKIRDDSHFPFPISQPFGADWNHENPQRFFSRFCQGWNHQGVLSDFQGWVSCGQDSMIQISQPSLDSSKPIFFQQSCRCCATDSSDWPAFVAGMGLRLSVPFFWPISFVWTPPWQPSTLGHWEGGISSTAPFGPWQVNWIILPYWNLISIGISGFPGVDFKVPSWFSWGYSLGNVLETGWSYSTVSIKITLITTLH